MADFVVERRGEWSYLPITGMEVNRCFFDMGDDFGIVAHSSGGDTSELRLGRRIQLLEGKEARVVSCGDPGAADLLLQALGRTVDSVRTSSDSRLEVRLDGGFTLAVEALPRVEAWEVRGPGGVFVVAGTDADEPAIWDDSSAWHSFRLPQE